MLHDDFVHIAHKIVGDARGWQQRLVSVALTHGYNLSQSTLSQIVNKKIEISSRVETIINNLHNKISNNVIELHNSNINDEIEEIEPEELTEEDLNDDEIMSDIAHRFSLYQEAVQAVVEGSQRGRIIYGGSGLGKSSEVDTCEKNANGVFVRLSGVCGLPDFIRFLYKIRNGGVGIIDDCDSLLEDEDSLNIFKAAFDTRQIQKTISYHKRIKLLDDNEKTIPSSFSYSGRLLVITNKNLKKMINNNINKKLIPHWKAIIDRVGFLSLELDTPRRRFLWIKYKCQNSSIFQANNIYDRKIQEEILSFIKENINHFDEPSLRLVVNLCEYRLHHPRNWKEHAKLSLMNK